MLGSIPRRKANYDHYICLWCIKWKHHVQVLYLLFPGLLPAAPGQWSACSLNHVPQRYQPHCSVGAGYHLLLQLKDCHSPATPLATHSKRVCFISSGTNGPSGSPKRLSGPYLHGIPDISLQKIHVRTVPLEVTRLFASAV